MSSLMLAGRGGTALDRGVLTRPRRPLVVLCSTVLGLVFLVGIFARLVEPHDPNAVDLLSLNAGPSASHWLGTDELGRDLLSRLIAGSRTALFAPLCVVAVATVIGVALALTATWFGGWIDQVVARALDVGFSFPSLLLAVVAVAVFGSGLTAPVIALAIGYVPYVGRFVRTGALSEHRLPYVDSCLIQGMPAWRISLRHVLPNLRRPILVQSTLLFGYAIVDFASLSFLGLGVRPPQSDWGLMVATGQASTLAGHPAQSFVGGVAIVVVVVSANLLGGGLGARDE
jgi:peptide/nickel transport system permease protein